MKKALKVLAVWLVCTGVMCGIYFWGFYGDRAKAFDALFVVGALGTAGALFVSIMVLIGPERDSSKRVRWDSSKGVRWDSLKGGWRNVHR